MRPLSNRPMVIRQDVRCACVKRPVADRIAQGSGSWLDVGVAQRKNECGDWVTIISVSPVHLGRPDTPADRSLDQGTRWMINC
jgi:hypothetical protein